jgi:hypothetical protein
MMQIPDSPGSNDIRDALLKLSEETEDIKTVIRGLSDKVDKIEYKFDIFQKGTDGMVRMATTIIIATASVIVLSNLTPAISALITAFSAANAQ